MTLKVIGAGFGRTGTHSLKNAIEQLGFGPCHHMYEVRRSPEQIAAWSNIVRGSAPDWDGLFDGYVSQVDWPGSHYWQDLAAHFPDAKVILTTRNAEAWYASICKTILLSSTIGRTQDPDVEGRAGSELIYQLALQNIFGGRLNDKEFALQVYAKHQQNVINSLPAERLLVFDVQEGWAPLCDFLDVDRPENPFPFGNTTEEFRSKKSYL